MTAARTETWHSVPRPRAAVRPRILTAVGEIPAVAVREEFLLLWPDGGAAGVAPEVGRELPDALNVHPGRARWRIDGTSDLSTDLSTVSRGLSIGRRALAQAAADQGARLVAVGTPPYGPSGSGSPASDALRRLGPGTPGTPDDEVSCACAVHVGVPSRDVAVRVLDRLRPWLPVLVALGGNSPLRNGRDTGWDSSRFSVEQRRPASRAWARSSPGDAALEIRVADALLTVADAVLMAGLCRALVATCAADESAGRPVVALSDPALAAAARAAARRGLGAVVVDPRRGVPAPAGVVLDEALPALRPALDAAGDLPVVLGLLEERRRRGSGADRQRALWRQGDHRTFVQTLANLCAGVD